MRPCPTLLPTQCENTQARTWLRPPPPHLVKRLHVINDGLEALKPAAGDQHQFISSSSIRGSSSAAAAAGDQHQHQHQHQGIIIISQQRQQGISIIIIISSSSRGSSSSSSSCYQQQQGIIIITILESRDVQSITNRLVPELVPYTGVPYKTLWFHSFNNFLQTVPQYHSPAAGHAFPLRPCLLKPRPLTGSQATMVAPTEPSWGLLKIVQGVPGLGTVVFSCRQ